jgi:sugar lactone lactonase YvrE
MKRFIVHARLSRTSLAFCLLALGVTTTSAQELEITTFAGLAGVTGIADGIGRNAKFNEPRGIVADDDGNVYVTDSANCTLRKITPTGTVFTFAGMPGQEGTGSVDGNIVFARFGRPRSRGNSFIPQMGLAMDTASNLFVADSENNTIRKITPSGYASILAGLDGFQYPVYADGPGRNARFYNPTGIATDRGGNIYVADMGNYCIRKITPSGTVTTLAGNPTSTISGGYADGVGNATRFSAPCGVAVDNAGNVYVIDMYVPTIRKITPQGVVSTFVGQAGSYGPADGTGGDARFNSPCGIAIDREGNLFVSEWPNNTIRKITPDRVVTTVAGQAPTVGPQGQLSNNAGSTDGIGSAARFNVPIAITVDRAGTVYIADTYNHTIRKGAPVAPPQILTQPQNAMASVGQSASFTFVATGVPSPTYQWQKDGTTIAGATNTTLTIANAQPTDIGAYTVVVTNARGSVTSTAGTLTVLPSRLASLSVRSPAGTGDQSLILGFYIGGKGSKQVLIRGIGPTLAQYGVAGMLADPQLKLFNTANTQINQNDDWGGGTSLSNAFDSVRAFTLPANSKDAALLVPLPLGGYSAQVNGANNSTGVALIEAYEADTGTPSARFVSLSARNQVGTGDNILIVGFVVTGNSAKQLLIRGVGPTLATYGVSGVLADPKLELYSVTTKIYENNDWGGTTDLNAAFTATQAFPLPASSKDAALLVTLQPGTYTAQVSGVDQTTGVALVEVYEMP